MSSLPRIAIETHSESVRIVVGSNRSAEGWIAAIVAVTLFLGSIVFFLQAAWQAVMITQVPKTISPYTTLVFFVGWVASFVVLGRVLLRLTWNVLGREEFVVTRQTLVTIATLGFLRRTHTAPISQVENVRWRASTRLTRRGTPFVAGRTLLFDVAGRTVSGMSHLSLLEANCVADALERAIDESKRNLMQTYRE